MLTHNEILQAVPPHLRTAVTPMFVDKLNNLMVDPLEAEEFHKNFVHFNSILSGEHKFKTEDYMHAVAYVTYKLYGYSNKDAYSKTFPDRIRKMVAQGYDEKRQSAAISAYTKGALVTAVLQQAIIPAHVLFQGKYNKAVGVLAEIMEDGTALNKDRVAAADSLMRHLTPPQESKVKINMAATHEISGMGELKETIQTLVIQQREAILNGQMSAGDIAGMKLIDVKATEVT